MVETIRWFPLPDSVLKSWIAGAVHKPEKIVRGIAELDCGILAHLGIASSAAPSFSRCSKTKPCVARLPGKPKAGIWSSSSVLGALGITESSRSSSERSCASTTKACKALSVSSKQPVDLSTDFASLIAQTLRRCSKGFDPNLRGSVVDPDSYLGLHGEHLVCHFCWKPPTLCKPYLGNAAYAATKTCWRHVEGRCFPSQPKVPASQ